MAHDPAKLFVATAMPDPDWWHALWPDPVGVVESIGVEPGMRVVDLCAGDGHFTIPIAKVVGEGRVVAIDLDEAMLATAKSKADAAGRTNIEFVCGDAMELRRWIPDPVDVVVIANTFHGAPDPSALARAVREVLRDGGSFVVVNWWPRPREETTVLGRPRGPRDSLRFSPEQVAAWVEPAGFTLEAVRDVGPYHYGVIFRATPRPEA